MKRTLAFVVALLTLAGCERHRPIVGDGVVFGVDPGASTSMAEARFNYPEDAVEAPDGSIYVSDAHSHVIRRMKDGEVSVFAGTFVGGFNGDGHRQAVDLNRPTALTFDPNKSALLFADSGNRLIRRVDLESGVVSTVAGIPGVADLASDGAKANKSPVGYVSSLKWDGRGNLWFIAVRLVKDWGDGGGIFYIDPDGVIHEKRMNAPLTLAATRDISISDDRIEFLHDDKLYRYFDDGRYSSVQLPSVFGKGIEKVDDALYVGSHTELLRFDSDFNAATIASGFANIANVKPAAKGFLITDSDQGVIYSFENGVKKQLTGTAPARNGALVDVKRYDEETLLILDNQMPRIFRYDIETGKAKPWAGKGVQGWASINVDRLKTNFYYPAALAIDADKNVYVAEQHRIMKIDSDDQVSLFAGYETAGDVDSTEPTAARMQGIRGIAFDVASNMFVADTYNNKIRKITPDGAVTTFAGTGVAGAPVLGAHATKSPLNRPHAVLPLSDGSVLIADSWNNTVLRVDQDGIVHTFAGVPVQRHYQGMGEVSGDGGLAKDAKLNTPVALAVGKTGEVYISDNFNHRLRVVTRDGTIHTFAGDTQGYAPGGKLLNFPTGIDATDDQLFVADSGNRLIVRYNLDP